MNKFSLIHWVAAGLIFLTILMNYVYYNQTGNFDSPIIEYEFAENSQEIRNIFIENNELKKDVIKGVRDQNMVDYAYMIFYSALLVLSFHNMRFADKKNIYVAGVVFSFIALLGDVTENIQMFRISEKLVSGTDFSEHVKILYVITRIKWFSLAFAFFIMSFHFYKNKFAGKVFALISSMPLIVLTAFFMFKDSGNDFVKIFTSFIFLSFISLIVWIFISGKINPGISFYKKDNN